MGGLIVRLYCMMADDSMGTAPNVLRKPAPGSFAPRSYGAVSGTAPTWGTSAYGGPGTASTIGYSHPGAQHFSTRSGW